VQSILASAMSLSFKVVAASSYSGARALQWPHQGAKTEVVGLAHALRRPGVSYLAHILTLCKHETMVVDKGLE